MVCPYALSRPGGVQGQAVGLARALRRLGHEVAVLAPGGGAGGGGGFDGTHQVGRPVGVRANGSVAPVALSPAAALRVARFVRRHRPDVVHLHEPLAPVAGYACLASRPAPLVGTYHRAGSSALYRLLRPAARWANGRLDARCAVSEAARDTAAAALGGTYEVLFNGVELARFAAAEPWPTTAPTVLFLGRHEVRKGLAVLLEAFAGVPGPAELWVAGDGPATAELRRRYPPSDRVRWLGVIPEEEVAARLAGAGVLCAPSLHGESFGMVLLEAMAARCAVVASDLPGYRAAAGGHAVLVPPGDVRALAGALAAALAGLPAGDDRTGPAAAPGGETAPWTPGAATAPAALDAAAAHAAGWSMDRLAGRYLVVYEAAVRARAASRRPVT